MAAHAQRTASLPLPSICFPASPSPRQRRPQPSDSVGQQECCSPSRRFRLPTQRFRAHGNLRSLGHSVVHHFRRNLTPDSLDMKRIRPSSVPASCEIVSREPHSAHHVYLEEAVPVRIGISANGFGSKMPTLFTRTSSAGSFAITASAPANQKVRQDATNLGRCSMRSDCRHRRIDALLCTTVYVDTRTFARKRLSDRNPIPAVDPVTSAILPVSLRSTLFSCRKPVPSCRHVLLALPQGAAVGPLSFPI